MAQCEVYMIRAAREAVNVKVDNTFGETLQPLKPSHHQTEDRTKKASAPRSPVVHDGRWTWTDWPTAEGSISGEDVGVVNLRTTGDLDEGEEEEEDKAGKAARGGEVD